MKNKGFKATCLKMTTYISIRLNLRKMSEDFRKSKYFQEKVIIYMLGAFND
jgi:hypothetical protein